MSNYQRLFEPYYTNLIWQTLKLSLIATIVEAIVGFPVAYALARARPAVKAALAIVVMIPLMTSVVVKTFGWYMIFGAEGPFAGFWRSVGVRGGSLVGSEVAVIIGLVEFGEFPPKALSIRWFQSLLSTDIFSDALLRC